MAAGDGYTLQAGEMVDGHYRVERPLGKGGMGAVYEVTDVYLNQRYALKTLLPHPKARPDLVVRFQLEAQVGAYLAAHHGAEEAGRERILQVLHCGFMADGRPYAVMPLLKAITLTAYLIKRHGRLDFIEACELAHDLCLAVEYIHSRNVVHRDIKPDNIFLVPYGSKLRAILADYGLAKRLELNAPAFTADGGILGTPGWAPREQLAGVVPAFSMDIFPLAKTIFLMLTGRSPWAEQAENEVHFFFQDRPPRAAVYTDFLEDYGQLETNVAGALSRCLSHDPAKRDDAYALGVCFEKARRAATRRAAGLPAIEVNATIQDGVTIVSTELALREAEENAATDVAVAVETADAPTKRGTQGNPPPSWEPPRAPAPIDHKAATRAPQTKPMFAQPPRVASEPVQPAMASSKESSAKTPKPLSYPVQPDPKPLQLASVPSGSPADTSAASPVPTPRTQLLVRRIALGAVSALVVFAGLIGAFAFTHRTAVSGSPISTATPVAPAREEPTPQPSAPIAVPSAAPSTSTIAVTTPPSAEPAPPPSASTAPTAAQPTASNAPSAVASASKPRAVTASSAHRERPAPASRTRKEPTRVEDIGSGLD